MKKGYNADPFLTSLAVPLSRKVRLCEAVLQPWLFVSRIRFLTKQFAILYRVCMIEFSFA